MCGRFDFHGSASDLTELVGADEALAVGGSYNIAPMQPANVVWKSGLRAMRFGWRRRDKSLLINARSESLQLSIYRKALRDGRAVVPAHGFYEWQPTQQGKQPFYFFAPDHALIYLAALAQQETETTCFIIITQPADSTVGQIHARMPWALPDAHMARRWLDNSTPQQDLARTRPTASLMSRPVSPRVNKSSEQGPQCIVGLPGD